MNTIMKYISMVVVTALVVGGATYYSVNKNADLDKVSLEATINDLETKVSILNKQIEALTPPSPSGSTDVFNIPELGIQITLPDSLKDLVYVTSSGTFNKGTQSYTAVNLSTLSLTNLDQGCSVKGTAPALGALSKVDGQYTATPNFDNTIGALVKQFSSFYISFSGPQAACSSSSSVIAKAVSDLAAFRASFSTIAVQN